MIGFAEKALGVQTGKGSNVMRSMLAIAMSILLAVPAAAHNGESQQSRNLQFPDAADGTDVLTVDLHTHSVFSDGHVWPTVRVWEAVKDGVDAVAITEHIEYQPHSADIPNPDRNRAFTIAQTHAAALADAEKSDVIVIPGAEITRDYPPGHVNAVFLKDVNPLQTGVPFRGNDRLETATPENIAAARQAIEAANQQGAFVFWNHPYWLADFPSGVPKLSDFHRELIARGMLHGIEVANGADFSEDTLRIALDNDLVILGTSDIHGLIDYEAGIASGGHRTATLVLTEDRSAAGIHAALTGKRTAAVYKGQLIGREAVLTQIIGGALSLTSKGLHGGSTVLKVELRNDAPVDLMLRFDGPERPLNTGPIVTVGAHAAIQVSLIHVPESIPDRVQVSVLNAITAPGEPLRLELPLKD